MTRSAEARTGFTIVEVVVVMGITGILLGLMLPAIQRVRESANRTVCMSQLRQLALAAHAFHNDHSRLPPGYLGPGKSSETTLPQAVNEGQWIGHLPMLLPYLNSGEAFQALGRSIRFEVGYVARFPWTKSEAGEYPNVSAYQLGQVVNRLFLCPSVPHYREPIGEKGCGTVVGIHVFHSTRTGWNSPYFLERYTDIPQFHSLARTHYLGVAGTGNGDMPELIKWEGVYTNRSSTTLGQLAGNDGSSQTLLYGEACGSRGRYQNSGLSCAISWVGGGALGTYRGLERGSFANVDTFASFHPSGVHFVMADASIRQLRHGLYQDPAGLGTMLSWHLLQQLAGIRDGGTLDCAMIMEER